MAEICRQQNLTLLMVTHQFEESKSLFDRILMIENGKILTDKLIV
ncbi:putative thiamin ABC transporterATP-binding protein [Actinobacillus pleuropneumoniae]|nr:putative thiamine ABC transporter ATP-binding protein [Actinobacillus pleuropneumoniae]KIE96718.1 putative thiamin ABC transporterATP-binding protein [Actinobacillus pleuropneumoniae]